MDSIRQQQVARMVQDAIADFFIKRGSEIYEGAFVTVTEVKMTPDLLEARIYLSIYNVPNADAKQEVLEALQYNSAYVRKGIGTRLRNKVRRIPSLDFFMDDSLDTVDKLDDLFDGLEIPPEKSNEDFGDEYKNLDE